MVKRRIYLVGLIGSIDLLGDIKFGGQCVVWVRSVIIFVFLACIDQV